MTLTLNLIRRALLSLPPPQVTNRTIHLALSGGVDSSVSAFLLQQRGYHVNPVLMRCWDDDAVEQNRPSCYHQDFQHALAASRVLGLDEPRIMDLVKEYWTFVFDPYLNALGRGETPNLDLWCNRYIKFGAFTKMLKGQLFATGHYARVENVNHQMKLLTAVDKLKDQSYFLAGVSGNQLKNVVFPVGVLLKSEVREIARFVGLPAAEKESSKGICFVGKKNMPSFLKQYLPDESGVFVDVDTGEVVGDITKEIYAYTRGERARLGGMNERYYVLGKQQGIVWVVKGWDHPALLVEKVECQKIDWVGTRTYGEMEAKLCSKAQRVVCLVQERNGGIQVQFKEKQRAVMKGQAIVLYRGEECLGAAWPELGAMDCVQMYRQNRECRASVG